MTDNKLTDEGRGYMNTDVELFREPSGPDFSAPKCFRTQDCALGINVGGTVFVRTLRAWHELAKAAMEPSQLRAPVAQRVDSIAERALAAHQSIGRILADPFGAQEESNGRFMVRAAECHHELVGALNEIVARTEDQAVIKIAAAAIAKTEGWEW